MTSTQANEVWSPHRQLRRAPQAVVAGLHAWHGGRSATLCALLLYAHSPVAMAALACGGRHTANRQHKCGPDAAQEDPTPPIVPAAPKLTKATPSPRPTSSPCTCSASDPVLSAGWAGRVRALLRGQQGLYQPRGTSPRSMSVGSASALAVTPWPSFASMSSNAGAGHATCCAQPCALARALLTLALVCVGLALVTLLQHGVAIPGLTWPLALLPFWVAAGTLLAMHLARVIRQWEEAQPQEGVGLACTQAVLTCGSAGLDLSVPPTGRPVCGCRRPRPGLLQALWITTLIVQGALVHAAAVTGSTPSLVPLAALLACAGLGHTVCTAARPRTCCIHTLHRTPLLTAAAAALLAHPLVSGALLAVSCIAGAAHTVALLWVACTAAKARVMPWGGGEPPLPPPRVWDTTAAAAVQALLAGAAVSIAMGQPAAIATACLGGAAITATAFIAAPCGVDEPALSTPRNLQPGWSGRQRW